MKKPLFVAPVTAIFLCVGCFTTNVLADEVKAPAAEADHAEHHKSMKRLHRKMMKLKEIDTNEDGQIDLNEYLANAEARFKRMDLDGDGYLTHGEHREYAKQMRAKHKEMRKQWREQHRKQAPESE